MQSIKQQSTKTYRQKKIDKFLDKYFPIKEVRIPTSLEIRNAVIKEHGLTRSQK